MGPKWDPNRSKISSWIGLGRFPCQNTPRSALWRSQSSGGLDFWRPFGRKGRPEGPFWEPFWSQNRSKNDAKIDTKIDAEKVSKNDAKMMPK